MQGDTGRENGEVRDGNILNIRGRLSLTADMKKTRGFYFIRNVMRHQYAVSTKNAILGYSNTRLISKSWYNSSSPIMAVASSKCIFVEWMIWSSYIESIMLSSVYLIFVDKTRELFVVDSQDCEGKEVLT